MSGPGLAIRILGEISKESGLIKLSTFEDKVWTAICSGCLFYALLTTGDWTDGKYFDPIIDGTDLFDGIAVFLLFIGIYRLNFK